MDPSTLADMKTDLGRIVERTPVAVVRPASVEDFAIVVRTAARESVHVTVCGMAHSQNAQGLSVGGILIDMRSLAGEVVID